MTSTAAINMINIQVLAEPAMARDKANGTYAAKVKADSRHYHWHGTEQTIPMGMDGDPEGFAAALRKAMPLVDTLRVPFNLASFNADGSLHPQMERFLAAAAREGFKLLIVQNEGLAQRASADTPDSLAKLLSGTVMDRMTSAWQKMDAWLDRHAAVQKAVWGYELANEPAAYARGAVIAPWGTKQTELDRFVALYAQHMEKLAKATGADADDKILVGGWGYSGTFAELDRPVMGGKTALDFLESAMSGRLVWSAHLYPGWHGTGTLDAAGTLAKLEQVYAPMTGRALLLTEFNLDGSVVNDTTRTADAVHIIGRMQEWFADKGFGMGWFPGVEAGAASLVTIDNGSTLRFLHQHSYALAMNAFTLDDKPAAFAGNDQIEAQLIRGLLRNEVTDPDWDASAPFDAVAGFGLAVGYDGRDTLIGREDANNLLYGGTSNDLLIGAGNEDFLFGQNGNDVLIGNAGRDHLYGGRGDDMLFGGAGNDVLEGGRGADLFSVGAGSDIITDFSAAEGDTVELGGRYTKWSQVSARIKYVAHDGPEVNDVRISHADGSATLILNARGNFGANQVVFPGLQGVIEAGATGSVIAPGWADRDGEIFGTDSFIVNGSEAKDRIYGTTKGDRLNGFGGNDLLDGRRGNDTLSGGNGNDTLFGGDGNDVLHMGNGRDLAYGGWGDDKFYTGKQGDRLYGEQGDDLFVILAGSSGHVIAGGLGADTYQFRSDQGGASARITDFYLPKDRVQIDGATIDLGNLPAGFSTTQTATGTILHYATSGEITFDGLFF